MASMAYCRFRNTLTDLELILEELARVKVGEKLKNPDEEKARQRIREIAAELVELENHNHGK